MSGAVASSSSWVAMRLATSAPRPVRKRRTHRVPLGRCGRAGRFEVARGRASVGVSPAGRTTVAGNVVAVTLAPEPVGALPDLLSDRRLGLVCGHVARVPIGRRTKARSLAGVDDARAHDL